MTNIYKYSDTTMLLSKTTAALRHRHGLARQLIPQAVTGSFSTSTAALPPTYSIVPKEDFGRYQEYSVIHTDRSLNLMSEPFQTVMRDLNALLKYTYQAHKVIIVPGYGIHIPPEKGQDRENVPTGSTSIGMQF